MKFFVVNYSRHSPHKYQLNVFTWRREFNQHLHCDMPDGVHFISLPFKAQCIGIIWRLSTSIAIYINIIDVPWHHVRCAGSAPNGNALRIHLKRKKQLVCCMQYYLCIVSVGANERASENFRNYSALVTIIMPMPRNQVHISHPSNNCYSFSWVNLITFPIFDAITLSQCGGLEAEYGFYKIENHLLVDGVKKRRLHIEMC